jgi:DNA-binding response OmpR family regulator
MEYQWAVSDGDDPLVLVVEDSGGIREYVRLVLERGGCTVVCAEDGELALQAFHARRPDLVVLDVWLPRMDGWEVLDRLRQVDEAVPVIMLTSLDDESSKVRGLMGGADDFVVKPVGPGELMARVTAQLRRSRMGTGATAESMYDDGQVRVDFANSTVAVHGTEVSLTPLEFRLLSTFLRRAGETLSSGDLMELVWNDYSGTSRDPVKVYVGYLRRKLATADGGADLIETVRGFGYRYAAGPARS